MSDIIKSIEESTDPFDEDTFLKESEAAKRQRTNKRKIEELEAQLEEAQAALNGRALQVWEVYFSKDGDTMSVAWYGSQQAAQQHMSFLVKKQHSLLDLLGINHVGVKSKKVDLEFKEPNIDLMTLRKG